MLLEEFDATQNAVINPEMIVRKIPDFPDVSVSCFSLNLFQAMLAFFEDARVIGEVHSADGILAIYEVTYKGETFAFFRSPVGEPSCVGNYEDIVAMGSKQLILFGNCGVLDKNIEDCGIIIPSKALRDEGLSYHYAPPSDFIDVNPEYRDLFQKVLAEFGYPYVEGVTWTTDACYRETRGKVEQRKKQGAICVEMECAGMQAMCNFRKTGFFQFLYAGDNLDHSEWQPRSLSGQVRLDDKSKIALLAFELGLKIKEKMRQANP
ncbi:MAG: nucleoside phosphorylase [Acetatifactor sp.]|nr:nucleoside phosphorylase [Acetatifactor sp.]